MINLDPAVIHAPFQSNIDIRDSVNYKEVMKQYNLGPNGGILASSTSSRTKVDQVVNLLEKRTAPDPEKPDRKPIERILVDTPGQIEVFVWSASARNSAGVVRVVLPDRDRLHHRYPAHELDLHLHEQHAVRLQHLVRRRSCP